MSAAKPASAKALASARLGGVDLFRFALCGVVVFGHYWYVGPITFGQGVWPIVDFPSISLLKYSIHGFFMISGFAIMYTTRGRTAVAFAIQRLARMWPAAFLCPLISWALLHEAFSVAPGFRQVINSWMIFPIGENSGNGVDWSYWTMTYELRFYLMIFIAMIITDIHRFRLPILAAWLVVSAFDVIHPGNHLAHFISLDWYSGCFIIGALTFAIWEKQGLSRWLSIALLLPSFVVTSYQIVGEDAASFDVLQHAPMIEVTMWVVPLLSWALMVGSLMIRLPWPWLAKFSAFLGSVTFPLYLLHQLAGYRIINDMVHVLPLGLRWLAPFTAVAVMFAIASVIALWWEPMLRPVIQKLGRSLADRLAYSPPPPKTAKEAAGRPPMLHAE